MDKKPFIIIGKDRYTKYVISTLSNLEIDILGILNDKKNHPEVELLDIPILSHYQDQQYIDLINDKTHYFIASDNSSTRQEIYSEIIDNINLKPQNIVDKSATVLTNKIGYGNYFGPGVVIGPDVTIGNFNVFLPNVIIENNTEIHDYNNFNSSTIIGYNVTIRDKVFFSSGAIVSKGIEIASQCTIGPGSVVFSSLEENTSVFGNPAKTV